MSDHGFSTDPSMVRVDFFKPSGKWYTTEAVKWLQYHNERDGKFVLIRDAFLEALQAHLKVEGQDRLRLSGMTAVCLEPYHESAFPLMVVVP